MSSTIISQKGYGSNQAELLSGVVEMDETYIGGKPRRRNNDKDDNDNFPIQTYVNEFAYRYNRRKAATPLFSSLVAKVWMPC